MKVKIILSRDGQKCRVRVVPPSVCVAPGGIIRWKVRNGCGRLDGKIGDPALQITDVVMISESGTRPADWLEQACEARFVNVAANESDSTNRLLCEVPDETASGFYKYALKGKEVETLDPNIEVRGPH